MCIRDRLITEQDSSGYLLVREVYPDSPAQMAGIKTGALIISCLLYTSRCV